MYLTLTPLLPRHTGHEKVRDLTISAAKCLNWLVQIASKTHGIELRNVRWEDAIVALFQAATKLNSTIPIYADISQLTVPHAPENATCLEIRTCCEQAIIVLAHVLTILNEGYLIYSGNLDFRRVEKVQSFCFPFPFLVLLCHCFLTLDNVRLMNACALNYLR